MHGVNLWYVDTACFFWFRTNGSNITPISRILVGHLVVDCFHLGVPVQRLEPLQPQERHLGHLYVDTSVYPEQSFTDSSTYYQVWKGDPATFDRYHVAQFITTTVPIPLLMLVVFGYKLICQTTMIRAKDMNFSGVAGMDVRSTTPVEEQPTDFWGRIWWILVK